MIRERVATTAAPAAIGPYSQAIRSGDWLFLSGQLGLDPATGVLVAGGTKAQAERALDNIGAVLQAAGLGFADVVRMTVYLVDLDDFAAVNEVYARYVLEPYPARVTIGAAGLPAGARIEIDAIARGG